MIQYSFWSEHKQTIYFSVLLLVTILIGGVFYFFRIVVGDGLVIAVPPIDTIQLETKNTQPVSMETQQVLGIVEKISGQEITLKDVKKSTNTENTNLSAVNQELQAVVIVNQSTIIEILSYKDGATITRESDADHESAQKIQAQNSSLTPPVPPNPFTREKITLSDVRSGDVVSVTAVEDLLIANQFTATKIVVMIMPDSISALPLTSP